MTVSVLLTHDVDWSITGPSQQHILARKDRFDDQAFAQWKYQQKPIYYNIHEMAKIELEMGVKSTFFFRPFYETGDKYEYAQDMQQLSDEGWEVGLHVNDLTKIKQEKQTLEDYARCPIYGARTHYLKTTEDYWDDLQRYRILYDSSVCENRHQFLVKNAVAKDINNVVVFPITIADCFMWTYWHQTESSMFETLEKIYPMVAKVENPIITVLWHDTSLKMRGGRKYKEVVRFFKNKGCTFLTGLEAYEKIKK